MFGNDNIDAETLECRLSSRLFRGSVNSPIELWAVNHVAKLSYLVERKSDLQCASGIVSELPSDIAPL